MVNQGDPARKDQDGKAFPSTAWAPKYTRWTQTRSFGNLGNLSYRNAIILTLLHTPVFLNWVEECHGESHQCDPKHINLVCALHRLIRAYWPGEPNGHGLMASMELFWDWFRAAAGEGLGFSEPQDAREFVEVLLECFYQDADLSSYRDLRQVFQVGLKKLLVCKYCGGEASLQPDQKSFLVASFPHENLLTAHQVTDAIAHNLQESSLHWTCENCKSYIGHSLREYIRKLPEVLLVQVNRFGNKGKLRGRVLLGDELILRGELYYPGSQSKANSRYELYSIVFHKGNSKNRGQYISAVKGPTGTWALMNGDDVRKELTLGQLLITDELGSQAYILAYRRLPLENAFMRRENNTSKLSDATVLPVTSTPPGYGTLGSNLQADKHDILSAPVRVQHPGGVAMTATVQLPGEVKWNFQQNLPFPSNADRLIQLKPRARTIPAKLRFTFVSAETGETLEGEAKMSLVPKRKRKPRAEQPPKSKKARKRKAGLTSSNTAARPQAVSESTPTTGAPGLTGSFDETDEPRRSPRLRRRNKV